jgi:muramoyltetrapeptide carboxypeptidase
MNRPPPLFAPRLRPGDTVGVFSPSWGGAGAFPHRTERGVAQLRALGFQVKLAPHALEQRGFVSDTAANRAADLHQLFTDPAVKLILSAIGGDHGCHLLPLLDFDLVRRHPKLVMGFSDMTVLNVALWQATRLVTFNGPALLTDFAEYPEMFSYTRTWFQRATMAAAPIGPIAPADRWTEELLDWSTKADLQRPRALGPSPGWTWLKEGAGPATGVLVGGCLESLQHLRGTPHWPDWDGAIFFFETSELKPPPETVDALLMDYENMGVLDGLAGMLVGRPYRYTDEEKSQLRQVILDRTHRWRFPIVTDVDFGHTAPQLTLPIGCRAVIDVAARRLEILDAAVV